MCRKFECRKYIHYKTQTGTSLRKMQLQGLPAGNRTRVLWITRPMLYQLSYRSRCRQLGREFSIYIYYTYIYYTYIYYIYILFTGNAGKV